jgi:hypothetical protein
MRSGVSKGGYQLELSHGERNPQSLANVHSLEAAFMQRIDKQTFSDIADFLLLMGSP